MDEINKHLPTGEHCEEWIGAGEFENSAVVWLKDEKTGHYKARLRESVTKPAAEKFKVIPAPLPIEITDAIYELGGNRVTIDLPAEYPTYEITVGNKDSRFANYAMNDVSDALLAAWWRVKQERIKKRLRSR